MSKSEKKRELFVYVSGWAARGGTPGLSVFVLDAAAGKTRLVKRVSESVSFGNFALDTEKSLLYVCNEDDLSGELGYNGGRIYGYAIDAKSGALTERFRAETLCANPTGVCFDRAGRFMAVSNHGTPGGITTEIARGEDGVFYPKVHCNEAVVELFSLDADGTPLSITDAHRHGEPVPSGKAGLKNINHVNCIARAPGSDLFAACDKGDGCLYLYRLDAEKGTLASVNKCSTIGAGGHPRVCVFHPERPYLFVNHEAASNGRMDVCSFEYGEDGALREVCTVNTLPSDYSLRESSMEQQGMCLHPGGIALYTVQRGNNAVCVLGVNPFSGELCVLQHIDVPGLWPRGCAISPDGACFAVACRDSGEVFFYDVEPDGVLSGPVASLEMKGCAGVAFYQP